MYASQEKLIEICQDIIELINTDQRLWIENQYDPQGVLHDIEELAQGYWIS
jgi:hypothetical protein